jgi:hypothetical protein
MVYVIFTWCVKLSQLKKWEDREKDFSIELCYLLINSKSL